MEDVFYELSVLTKAVAYKNLTLASQNIGLSQPQLSRIVAKIERSLNISLLDRSTKRKSGWTAEAFQVVNLYSKTIRNLKREIDLFKTGGHVKSLKIACLEGHMDFVINWIEIIYSDLKIEQIEVSIYEIDLLEKYFLKGHYDLAITGRDIGKKKYQYESVLGYQALKIHDDKSGQLVMSPFELQSKFFEINAKMNKRVLISNSLELRKRWLLSRGGKGTIPSSIRTKKSSIEGIPVTLLAQDTFHPELWKELSASARKAQKLFV
ncbi:MAG: LysR family transcriptional regulator [Bacteriovorax sp.]|jgi:hypothetical protein